MDGPIEKNKSEKAFEPINKTRFCLLHKYKLHTKRIKVKSDAKNMS